MAELTPALLAECLEAGADAAAYPEPCPACEAETGQRCQIIGKPGIPAKQRHDSRELPGDIDLERALRAMARVLRQADMVRPLLPYTPTRSSP